MLTMLINGRGEEDYALSDNEIRDSIISLITAGYETTSGALAWAVYTLLTLPGAWDDRRRRSAPRARRSTADRRGPGRADLPQRRCPRDASAVPTRRDLRAQGDARPVVRRAPHPGRTVADLQRLRHPSPCPNYGPNQPNSGHSAGTPSSPGLPQARATRIHPVQRGVASVHRRGHGHHRDDRDARPAGRQDHARDARSAHPRRTTSPRCPPIRDLPVEITRTQCQRSRTSSEQNPGPIASISPGLPLGGGLGDGVAQDVQHRGRRQVADLAQGAPGQLERLRGQLEGLG